jgi:hypothetical protein
MLEILERYGWDYFVYMRQPAWLLDLIVHKMEIEAKKAKAESVTTKHGHLSR